MYQNNDDDNRNNKNNNKDRKEKRLFSRGNLIFSLMAWWWHDLTEGNRTEDNKLHSFRKFGNVIKINTKVKEQDAHLPLWSRSLSIKSSLSFSSSDTIASSSSSVLFFGSHVILFSFFSRRRAFANHVDTCVNVIFVIIASIIFSPFVGYGFFLCSLSHAFNVAVDSRVAFLRRAAKSYPAPYLK